MEVAIKVENVSKMYKLYNKPTDRLKEAVGLSKKKLYREHFALNNVDISVKKGECVGIIGTNGAGKSTVLKIITGVLNPSSGNVSINGRISALLELGAGFNQDYTGIENIYLNGTMIGFTKEEIDERLQSILDFADIGDFVYQPVKTYSSGMFVRLAFAVAINIDPEILIVDEALSVGDVFFQAKCYKKFEEFKAQGKTILFVSHDLNSVSKYCDRVILLDHGKKVAEGKPGAIIDMYKKILVSEITEDRKNKTYIVKSDVVKSDGSWKASLNINPQNDTYGNGKAEIVDFGVEDEDGNLCTTVEKGHECTVKFKVKFYEDVDNPIYAFTVKNLRGTEIAGTNTMYEHIDTGYVKAGEEKIVKFKQRMDMQGTDYLISLGCTGYVGDEFVVYHRLYDIFNITVLSQENKIGFYDMNSTVTVE